MDELLENILPCVPFLASKSACAMLLVAATSGNVDRVSFLLDEDDGPLQ